MILHIIYHFNQDFIKVFTEWRVLHVEEVFFFFFFHADHFLKVFIEFVRLLLLFYVLVFSVLRHVWVLAPPTRD